MGRARGSIRVVFTAAALVAGILATVPSAVAGPPPDLSRPYRDGYVLVGYGDDVAPAARTDARGRVGALTKKLMRSTELVRLKTGLSVADAIAQLLEDPNVEYAEPDYVLQAVDTSNDPYYTGGSLWGMYGDATSRVNAFGSQAGEAWTAGETGSPTVVIGVIDEGIDINHPDLAANIWVNPGEFGRDANGRDKRSNGVDDDGNGYVDDVNGWDFSGKDNTVFDGSGDDHGTHVAGTIGARGGNGVGVAGVNWNVKMISAKFLGTNGGSTSDAILALQYLTALKTRAVNPVNIVATSNSWGGGGYSESLRKAIIAAGNAGILFVVAAGNSTVNIDTSPQYPAAYTCPTTAGFDCIISVASITDTGALSSFSNYGATSVDLGAPGSGIYSTLPSNKYGSYSGTSMATPHVSGAVALCASINPALTAEQLRAKVLGSVVATTSLAGKTSTGGRLDAGAMAASCGSGAAPSTLYPLSVTVVGSGSLTSPEGIDCSAAGGTCTVSAGGVVTLTAAPAAGWTLSSWAGCSTISTTTCSVSMTEARSVTATFSALTYPAQLVVSRPSRTKAYVSVATSGGTASWTVASCTGTCVAPSPLAAGTVITFTPVFSSGATRVAWSGCDSVLSNVCTVTVNGSESVTAKFGR